MAFFGENGKFIQVGGERLVADYILVGGKPGFEQRIGRLSAKARLEGVDHGTAVYYQQPVNIELVDGKRISVELRHKPIALGKKFEELNPRKVRFQ